MNEGFCEVSIDCDDCDNAEVFNDSVLTAYGTLKCDECGAVIQPGSRYERVAMKQGGTWSGWRSCMACREISGEFCDGGRMLGVLWDELEANWDNGAHLQACINRLSSASAKEHMRRHWLKWKGLP